MAAEQHHGRLSRGLIVRVGRSVYPLLERASLTWLITLVHRLKYRVISTPSWRVLAILDLLAAAEVRVWVAGGWGIDALVGRQNRPHLDVDLVISDDGPPYERVAQVLTDEGFRPDGSYHTPGIAIPWCHVWRHETGHKVEVLPVPLDKPPFAAKVAAADGWQPFTDGTIDGQRVPCLSAELQFLLHTGYPQREIDSRDVALLREHLSSYVA